MTDAHRTYPTAAAAWFAAMTSLIERRTHPDHETVPRETADEIVRCLDTLYRRRKIDLMHAAVLRIWGHRQTPPNEQLPGERSDWRLWYEAMRELEPMLRARGIVAIAQARGEAADGQ